MNPAQRKGRTAEAVRDLLLAHGRRRPLVLVVEDLHWIGPHSEEILRVLLGGVAADPLMVVLTYRPGYAQAFGEQTYFTRITLRALPEGQMQSLVERVASLGRNARPALGELRAVELIYEKSRTPELAYMFKHALTHDVAYETLLRGKRRELHRRTGEVIEELYPDRLPEFYETLAFHLTRGEAWDKAVDDLLKSAAKARAGFDYSAGSRFCSEAIAILRKMVPAPVELGRALEMLDDLESLQGRMEPANEAYEEAMALLEDAAARHVLGNKLLRERAVVRDGATIVYYEHGLGETTLILCHPVTAGLAVFQPLLERFCQDFRVVIWAPRGTGKDPLPGPYYTADFVEDLRAVVEAASARPAVVIGNSRGATIAIHFAIRYPHLVEKLVLAGLTPAGPAWLVDHPAADLLDTTFASRLRAALAADDWKEVMRAFVTQVSAGEAGTRKLIEGGMAAWIQTPSRAAGTSSASTTPAATCDRCCRRFTCRPSCCTARWTA